MKMQDDITISATDLRSNCWQSPPHGPFQPLSQTAGYPPSGYARTC